MVDKTKQEDMSGMDVIINAVGYSTTPGGAYNKVLNMNSQTAPVVVSGTSATVTFANMLTGLIISTNVGATTLTLDTAANIVAAANAFGSGAQVGDSIVFSASAAGTAGATVAVGSGGAFSAGSTGVILTGTQKDFIVRITNIATPAYVVYV